MGQDPSRPESRLPAAISYDGSNYGVGLTGAYAVKDYFLTYNYDWSWTRMDMIDGKGRSLDQGVRIGKSTNKWTAYTGWEKQEICGSRSAAADRARPRWNVAFRSISVSG